MMNFLIWYVPTILFALIFVTGLLMGLKRGFRKSVILAIHATVAFIICLVAYIIIVNDKATDSNIVSLVNNFMGEQGLQRAVLGQGDYTDVTTLTGIITQFILKQQTIDQGIALMLTDDGVYLASLVYQVYRLIFAIIFIFLYLILVFILYLVYFFFYPDRRYYKKKRKAMEAMQTEAEGVDNGEETKDKLALEAEEDDNTDSVIDEPINNSSNPEYDLAPKEDSIDVTDEVGDDDFDSNENIDDNNLEVDSNDEVDAEASFDDSNFDDESIDNIDNEDAKEDFTDEDMALDQANEDMTPDETDEEMTLDQADEDMTPDATDDMDSMDLANGEGDVFVADLDEADFKDEHSDLDTIPSEIEDGKKRKKTQKDVNLKKIGKRRRWIGMIIGGVRGLSSGLVILALIGAIFYIVSGTGKTKYTDEQNYFAGTSNELYYDIYKAMGEYGNHGVYTVLNSITDKSNFPYYLYLVDVVYSGSVEDPEVGKYSYNLAKEMGNFTTFGRKAMDLLLKYSSADIVKFMDQSVSSQDKKDMLTIITDTFKNEEFNAEFNTLIDEFEAGTYFFNMSLAFINSLIKNIDQAEFAKNMPVDAYESICILFKKGYYSEYIPSEYLKKQAIEEAEANGQTIEVEPEACITVRNLLSKEDVKELINVVINILSLDKNDDTTINVINYSDLIIPSVQKLSILSSDKKAEMNPVLKRMYLYLEYRYLQESLLAQKSEKNKMVIEDYVNSIDLDSVDWVSEIQQLLVVARSTMQLYGNIYTPDENDILMMIADEFDTTSTTKEDSLSLLGEVKTEISKSKLLDKILSTNGIYLTVSDFLVQNINENAYLKSNILYSNSYDENGNLVEYGELYNLLTGLEAILKSENEKQILTSLTSMEQASSVEVLNNIKLLINAFGDNDLNTILTSDLLDSIISAYLIANKTIDASTGLELYIPDTVLENVDGKAVNLIKKDQVVTLFTAFNTLLDGIIPYIDENSANYNNISVIIDSLNVEELAASKILEGTLANVIVSEFSKPDMEKFVTLPDEFKNVEYWTSANSGEIKKIATALKETNLDLQVLTATYKTDKERTDAITNMISNLSSDDIDVITESNVFYLTVSGILGNKDVVGNNLTIPSNVYVETEYSSNGSKVKAISKDEIKSLLNAVTILNLDLSNMNDLDVASLVNTLTEVTLTGEMKVSECYDSLIIQSIITEQLLSNENVLVPNEVLTGDEYVINGVTKKAISEEEIKVALLAIKKLDLDLNNLNNLNLDELVPSLNTYDDGDTRTKLYCAYDSLIIQAVITDKLSNLDEVKIPAEAYKGRNYTIGDVSYNAIPAEEIEIVVDAIDILGIKLSNMDTFDIDNSIIDKLLETNKYNSGKNIEYCYESKIISSLITENLIKNENLSIPAEVLSGNSYTIDNVKKNDIRIGELTNALIAIRKLDIDIKNANNLDVNSLVKTLNVVSDGDTKTKLAYAYDSLIIQAIITDKLLAIESLEIPNEVLSGSAYTISGNTKNAMLYTELESLVDTVVLLDLDLNNMKNLNVSSLVSKLVETDSSGVMNIDKCYSSLTVKSIITKNLLDNENISIPSEVVSGSTYTIGDVTKYAITDEEVKAAIIAVDKLNIDLDDMNNLDVQSLMSTFNVKDSSNKSKLDYCYDSLIISSTVTTKIKEYDSIKVPSEVLIGASYTIDGATNNLIEKEEVKSMVDAINCLELDLNKISETDISIKLDEAEVSTISESKIIQNTLSSNLSSSNDLIIPAYLLDSNGMIEDTEYVNLLTLIAKNKEMFFKVVDNKFNVTKVNFSTDTVKFATIKTLINDSEIIYATALYNILNNSEVCLPNSYVASADKNTLVNNYDSQKVVIDDELNYFIDGTIIAYGNDTTLSNIDTVATSTLINNLDGKVENAYQSKILAATIESKVENASSDLIIPYDAIDIVTRNGEFDYKQIEDVEMQSLINLVKDKDLALDFDNLDPNSFNFKSTNISKAASSKIIRATLYLKIKDVNEVVIPDVTLSGKLYETESDKYLSEEETSKFLELVVSNKVSLGLAANEKSPITIGGTDMGSKIAEGVKNLTVSKLIELLGSDIFHATVINNIGESRDEYGIIIPTEPTNYLTATEKDNLVNNFYSNIWYSESETETTLNALGYFIGFDKALSSLGDLVSNLNNYVKPLNDPIEEGSSVTKLSMIYESVVMKATLSNEVCKLATLKVPYDSIESNYSYVKDDVTITGYYLYESDIQDLIAVLNDEDLALDLNSVDLNDLNISTDNIELISKSRILRSSIYNKIITELDEELVVPNVVLDGMYETSDDNGYISEVEMIDLLTQLDKYGEEIGVKNEEGHLDVGNMSINVSNLKVAVLLDMISNSTILHATAISKMPEVSGIMIPKSYNAEATKDNIVENYDSLTWVQTNELIKLLTALEKLNIEKVSSAESLDIDDTINSLTSETINYCYDSVIMKLTLADKVCAIDSLVIPTDAYETTSYEITDIKSVSAIEQTEFNALVGGIKAAEVDVSSGAGNITLNENSTTLIPLSLILNATLSKNINENSSIVVPSHVNNTNGTIDQEELTLFLQAVYNGFGISNLSGITSGAIESGNIKDRNSVLNSIIMRATLSKNIMDNTNIITPSSVVDTYGIISKSELDAFLDAIITGFGINDLSSIDSSTVSPANIKDNDKVASSVIMRATITSKVEADGATNIYVADTLCSTDTNYNTDATILVLSKKEVNALLEVLSSGTEFKVSITAEQIAAMNYTDIVKYMSSNIFAINISNALINAGYTSIVDTNSTYTLDNGDTYNLVEASTYTYKLKSPTNIDVLDILAPSAVKTQVSILTTNDVLAYKYYVSTHT